MKKEILLENLFIGDKLSHVLGQQVRTTCDEQGLCTHCSVDILEGFHCLSEKNSLEYKQLGNYGTRRLSCQVKIIEEGSIRCLLDLPQVKRSSTRVGLSLDRKKKEFKLPFQKPKRKITS